MELSVLDYLIIAGYLLLVLAIGLVYRKRAGSGMEEFFVSGRSLPWWIAGTSMVATTFAADTPLAVTGLVAEDGLAGNWVWWGLAVGGMFTVFVYARLWRRAEVLTDVELIEMRYSGPSAAVLRGFRAVYVALIVNSIIIGWVVSAMFTVLEQTVLYDPAAAADSIPDSEAWFWIAAMLALVGLYSAMSGLWGVALVDFVQFFLAMGGCIALAVLAVQHVGGAAELERKAAEVYGSDQVLSFLPSFSGDGFSGDGSSGEGAGLPLQAFLVILLCQWWASWYPGAEPGGGGYVVQRMAACKNERHAVLATLWYQVAHYCVRPWPWILVALVAMVMYPEIVGDGEKAGPAFPAVIRELAPSGLRGLLLVAFGAAFMSTISTQMNWGASYLVNDVYKRFVRPDLDDRGLAVASRWASLIVLAAGGGVSVWMIGADVDIQDAWKLLLALGAGTGAVFMLRWFWWRVNAYTEIASMVASLVAFVWIGGWAQDLEGWRDEYTLLAVAAVTIAAWLIVTFVTPADDPAVLRRFYRKVHPAGPGWKPIAEQEPGVEPDRDLGRCILAALLGGAVVYLTLPGVGAMVFGHWGQAAGLLGAAIACAVLLVVVRPSLGEAPTSRS